ncbi:MAG: class I adenylate-forming enzyme family protein, partial [Pseudomonadota bacterium]|nr:class I adenylate-forming enzyme family protein [Pseudomonadota bacterium]
SRGTCPKSTKGRGQKMTAAPPDINYRSVLEMIRLHARTRPDQDCLISINQKTSITWEQLYRLTNKLSVWLHEKDIGANDRILVLTENSLENLILYFGIQRHGATFCTINIDINDNHMREMIERLSPKLVLWHNQQDLGGLHDKVPPEWISFGNADPNGSISADGGLFETLNTVDGDHEPPEVSTGSDDAVICFTSGTTDRPKGVIHSFNNYNYIGAQTAYLWGLVPEDRVLEYRSFSWSSSHQIVLQPLLAGGGCVVFADKFSFSCLFDWIESYRITKSIGIPAVINMLLDQPENRIAKMPKNLLFMSCSTAPLMEEQHRRFEETYGIKLIQHYGMTEGGTVAGNHHLTRRIGSVGKPGISQKLTIVDEGGAIQPNGTEGEIEIGGPQNATAYLNPDGSIEPVRGKRLKTGDLGILDDDGFLRVTGRAKDLVIRGGVNIAPLEIDNAVTKHPDVIEACTIGVPEKIYGEALICFAVPRQGTSLTSTMLDAHCADTLPDFKCPSKILLVDKIASNARGKPDREAMKKRWLSSKGGL